MSTNNERRSLKSPGGDSHDLFGAEFIGSPCHHRVLKPPGGGTSDIFGGSEQAATAEKPQPRKNSSQASSIVLDDNVNANTAPAENGHPKQGTCNERLFGPPLAPNSSSFNGTVNVAKMNGNVAVVPKTNGEVLMNGNDHTDAVSVNTKPMTNGKAMNGDVKTVVGGSSSAAPRQRVPPGGFSSGLW